MPANDWEWYILTQVDRRLDNLAHPLKNEKGTVWKGGFMTTPRCYTFRDGAVIISQHQKMGTLLDLVNLTKNADKNIIEPIAIYLTAELLGLMELLHSVNVVHADLKPDNFLVRHTPSTQSSPSLQLIDFGKAIDLHLEPGEEKTKGKAAEEAQDVDGKTEPKLEEDASVKSDQNGENEKKQNGTGGPNQDNTEGGQVKDGEDAAVKSAPASAAPPLPDQKLENGVKTENGRTGKYHLDYFGIAGMI